MNLLISIKTDSELISYEAIALAFLLASFDHKIQLIFDNIDCLTNPTNRIYGMIQSLALYDLPKAWVTKDYNALDTAIQTATEPKTCDNHHFDTIIYF